MRAKLFKISAEFLAELFKAGSIQAFEVVHGFPDGDKGRIIGIECDHLTNVPPSFNILVEHPGYPDVPEGGVVSPEYIKLESVKVPREVRR